MYSGKHKSFKSVLYRATKHAFCSDLSEEQAADYALELLRRLQLPFAFKEDTKYINIKNYRGSIPSDLIFFNGMRFLISPLPAQVTYDTTPEFITDTNLLSYFTNSNTKWLPIKYTGDIYHSTYHCNSNVTQNCDVDITYKINNNFIFLSTEEGIIEISYRALMIDKEGYPMIPDNQSFEDALYYYIIKEHLFGLLAVGKVTQSFYDKVEQDYSWYVGQATNNLKLAGMDHWEETMNGIRRLIQPQNLSDNGYKDLYNRERIKKF